jgi:membrane protein YdbS with pleckstrin-like domain
MWKAGLWLLRVLLAIAALWSFFGWAPLVDSEPLSALTPEQTPAGGVPAWAKSFHINHGAVVFNSFDLPSKNPWPLVVLISVTVAASIALLFSFPREARWRFLRRRLRARTRRTGGL